jgi:hypothetical protein
MKKFISNKGTIVFLMMVFFSGCSLLEADFSGEVEAYFAVNESNAGSNISYNEVKVLNATDEEDIRDNLDKVKDWTVEKVTYAIKNYQGDPSTTFSGTLGFSEASGTSPSISTSVSGLNLSSLSNGPRQALGLSGNDLATMASWLDSDPKIKVYLKGNLSQGPIYFDLVVYANLKIKASIL